MNPPPPPLTNWRKSSYSGTHTNCVEVASTAWHTSSYTNDRGACVEVAEGPVTGVRDSKNRHLGALYFDASEWRAFVAAVRREEL